MRLTLTVRFVVLFVLLLIATFHNSSSITCVTAEPGNPCLEGCQRIEINCRNRCGYNQDCARKCWDDYRKCEASCKSGSAVVPEEPVNY